MATLIRRAEALKRINQLEEKAVETGDRAGAEQLVKCYNAIMSCKVEERFFCKKCGKVIKLEKIPENDMQGYVLPGQTNIKDFL